MVGFADIVGAVADPFRSTAKPPLVGSTYHAEHPTVQAWVDNHPEVADLLNLITAKSRTFASAADAAWESSQRTLEAKREADADEARVHYDARNNGKPVDPVAAKRAARAKQNALANHEAEIDRSATVSGASGNTREAANAALKLVNNSALNDASIVYAKPVKLPKGQHPADIVNDQHSLLADLEAAKEEAEQASMPLEEGLAQAQTKFSAKSAGIRVSVEPNAVDWYLPLQRLNAAPRLGNGAVDVVDTEALLTALFPEQMWAAIETAIRTRYERIGLTLDSKQRRDILADIAARRDAAERLEVAAIFECWKQGIDVPLRKDTSPLALLGIESIKPGKVEEPGFIGKVFQGSEAR